MKIKIIIILIFFAKDIFSQPYYYYFVKQDSTILSDIHRIDFNVGNDELFIKNAGRINQLFWNSDQTNLFINQRNSVLDVIKLDSLNKHQTINDNFLSIVNIHDAPAINRFLIEYGDNDNEYSYTVIYNRTTYEPLDTINFYTYGGTFLSLDEKKLYKNIWDTTGLYFSAFDLINRTTLYNYRKVSNLNPSHLYYGTDNAKKGRALFLHSDSSNFTKRSMFVCQPDSGLLFDPVVIPSVRYNAFLSANTKYIILEEIDWKATLEPVHSGKMSIYNALNGVFISNLTLPPNGEILLFDNYPNMFYYFNRENHSVSAVDLTTLVNHNSGLPVKLQDSQGNLLQGDSLQ